MTNLPHELYRPDSSGHPVRREPLDPIENEKNTQLERIFNEGYRRYLHTPGAVHSLLEDATFLSTLLNTELDKQVDPTLIYEALLYGVEPQPVEHAEEMLSELMHTGDHIDIWSQGDGLAQALKLRKLGWDILTKDIKNPSDHNLFLYHDKTPALEEIIRKAQRRGNNTVFIVEDSPDKIMQAREFIAALPEAYPGLTIDFVLVNHKADLPEDFPPDIYWLTSLEEYSELVNDRRASGESISHCLDLDGLLIDPEANRQSRLQAFKETVKTGVAPEQPAEPSWVRLEYPDQTDAIFIADGILPKRLGEMSSRITETTQADINVFEDGPQALLVKELFRRRKHTRPPEWQGIGFRQVMDMINHLTDYRQRLSKLLPIPENSFFLPATDGKEFFIVEVSPQVGEINAQERLLEAATIDDRENVIRAILQSSFAMLTAPNIGADIKPANWVELYNEPTFVNVDTVPIIETHNGEVHTEIPRIKNPQIQQFLHTTHMTIKAVGYRFYQELCQRDPEHRTEYQQIINTIISEWIDNNAIPYEQIEEAKEISDIMSPFTSRVIAGGATKLHPDIAFDLITQYIDKKRKTSSYHPIYDLREMSFVLTEIALKKNIDLTDMNNITDALINRMSPKHKTAISGRLKQFKIDQPHLKFLTTIRTLTHLSDENIANEEELTGVSLEILKAVTAYIHAQLNPSSQNRP